MSKERIKISEDLYDIMPSDYQDLVKSATYGKEDRGWKDIGSSKELIEQHRDELAALITGEHGKVLADARGEVTRGLEVVEFACGAPHLLKGEFAPGDTIKVDADTVSGTLVFSTERSTVVAEAGGRRDARARATEDGDADPALAASGGRRRGKTVLDLPDLDEPKRDRDGGELVN